jgi:cell division protein ZapA
LTENKNTLSLKILDTEFIVKAETDSEKDSLIRIEEYVNSELAKIKEHNQFINHIRIAILGCMNITEQLFNTQDQMSELSEERNQESARYQTLEDKVTALDKEKNEQGREYDTKIDALKKQVADLQETHTQLDKQLNEKNELLNQYREKLKESKDENDANRKSILDLQNQLFENQIELVKLSKGADEAKTLEEVEEADATEQQELSDILKALKSQQGGQSEE